MSTDQLPDADTPRRGSGGFPLTADVRHFFDDLILLLGDLAGRVKTGSGLIGIGEAWEALENIETVTPEILVTILVSVDESRQTFHERNSRTLVVSADGVELSGTYSYHTDQAASDNSEWQAMSVLNRDGTLDGLPHVWMENIQDLMERNGCTVSVFREHGR